MAKYQQLTLEERNNIEVMLNAKKSMTEIATSLSRDISGIRKEIIRNRVKISIPRTGSYINDCQHMDSCVKRSVCSTCTARSKYRCRSCSKCMDNCSDFESYSCPLLSKKPYVCNQCSQRNSCKRTKYLYLGNLSHQAALQLRSSSRQGISYSQDELEQINTILKSKINNQSQSIHHTYINNKDSLPISERHLYTLINAGIFDTRNIDLPRKVRFKVRKKAKEVKVDKKCREGRTFNDYLTFLKNNPGIETVQLDTVEGIKGGACLLTIYFSIASLQLSYFRESNNARSVQLILDSIYLSIGHDAFISLFPCILWNNGYEFSNPEVIENYIEVDENHQVIRMIPRTHCFYCNPSSPYQKGMCERNHEFIRLFIPKSTSMNHYTQSDITLMMNHINNYQREKTKMKSPHSIFVHIFGETIAHQLSLVEIDPNDVFLNPKIFTK